jgi:hypothetical protein
MKINNTIVITGEINRNSAGTKEWGKFKITSGQYISTEIVSRIASAHGFGGQSMSVAETAQNPFTYDGDFTCWSD